MKAITMRGCAMGLFLAASAAANAQAGMLGWYRLDGNLNDSSGNGNHGSVNVASYTDQGYEGGAYAFNGSRGFINTIPRQLIPSRITESMWIYPLSHGRQLWGSGAQTSHSKDGYIAHVTGDGALNFYYWKGNATHGVVTTENTIVPLNAWSHVAFTLDDSRRVEIYLNGVKRAEGSFSTIADAHDHSHLMIGRAFTSTDGGGHWTFHGSIDEVRIYNRALSADEIVAISGRHESRVQGHFPRVRTLNEARRIELNLYHGVHGVELLEDFGDTLATLKLVLGSFIEVRSAKLGKSCQFPVLSHFQLKLTGYLFHSLDLGRAAHTRYGKTDVDGWPYTGIKQVGLHVYLTICN